MNKFIKQFEFEFWSNTMILNSLKTLKEKRRTLNIVVFTCIIVAPNVVVSRE
jgi:hypothetical protein